MAGNRTAGARGGTRTGVGIAALVMGVAALTMVVSFTLYPLGGVVAVVAVIFGIVGIWRAGRGMAIAGLICGALALVLAVTFTVRVSAEVIRNQDALIQMSICANAASTDTEAIECLTEAAENMTG